MVKLNGPSVRISSLPDAVLDHHIAMVCCGVEDVRHYRATARQVESSPIHVELKLLTQIHQVGLRTTQYAITLMCHLDRSFTIGFLYSGIRRVKLSMKCMQVHLWAFVIRITKADEANFAVFSYNFAQFFLTNQTLLKFPGIPDRIETAPLAHRLP